MIVDLLKKINKIFKNMFNQDSIAAATLAQVFGSELLKVQQNATTDSGHQPDIVKLNPKQFLVGETQYNSDQKLRERRIAEALQREAEAAYPLAQPQPQPYAQQVAPAPIPQQPPAPAQTPSVFDSLPVTEIRNDPWTSGSISALERIALSLERIANAVDKVDIKPKKKTVKRKTKIAKPLLLNETHA